MSEERKYLDLSKRLYAELNRREREIAKFGQPIAIVGMACRFPGGADLAAFWEQLEAGRNTVAAVPEGQARPDGESGTPASDAPGACLWGGYLDDIDQFDAPFFRIAPVEARPLDPQQRLLLETSWEALEEAGIDPEGLQGSRTGVFAGVSTNDYRDVLSTGPRELADFYTITGNSHSTAIGRVAFTLGLEGPAIAVDTACSSSLVALHQAVVSLQRGESDLALAGGVNVILSPIGTEVFARAGVLSPDGRCKTFDAAADGFVRGEGCAMVVLKRLSDAEAAGDRIWAVVRGSAVNQDGASAGLTVPSGPAQERVIGEALSRAGLEPSEVDYLEAHGTGTELGDPVEAHAAASGVRAGPVARTASPDRFGEDERRSSGGGGGSGGPDQDRAVDAPRSDPEASALRDAESADGLGAVAAAGDVGGDAVAGGGSPGARGSELVRHLGDERARGCGESWSARRGRGGSRCGASGGGADAGRPGGRGLAGAGG